MFQICTLNETASVLKKRQEIGRGLRLAVNQDGERIQGYEVNTLWKNFLGGPPQGLPHS